MNNKQEALQEFLIQANKAGYVTGEEKAWKKEKDESTTIGYTAGEWVMHDNFFGGEPYGGRLIVSYQQKPIWMMVYYGWVKESEKPDPIYVVLRKALALIPSEAPFRGPKDLRDGEFVYQNAWVGTLERYSGTEKITQNGVVVYEASYLGGMVDQRRGV